MSKANRKTASLRFAALAIFAMSAGAVYSQAVAPTNTLPDPYTGQPFGKLPDGRQWGSTAGIGTDPDGKSIWVAERCGAFAPPAALKPGVPFACDGSNYDPILKFDEHGNLVKSFGAGLLLFPHGLSVDPDGNVWVTDGLGKDGKGQQAIKFSPDGKMLMRLGKAGTAGSGPDEFNAPSAVLTAPNGDIFVADGHGGNTNARIVKFDKTGKFIKTWGKKGSGPGEFDGPHTLAMDSRGRLFVGDRGNNRIQIFDQDGNFLDQWAQFSRPSGVYIDKNDVIYVADSESKSVNKDHGDWTRGIRVGSAKDGKVMALIPDPDLAATTTSAAEGVTADAQGNIYGAEVGPKRVMKYVKK
jgi:DNA-binding beta-propeller fold protein YncE